MVVFIFSHIRSLAPIYLFKLSTYYFFYHLFCFNALIFGLISVTSLLLHRSSLIFVLFYFFKELQWFIIFNLLNCYWHFWEMGCNICNQDCSFIYSSQFSLHLCWSSVVRCIHFLRYCFLMNLPSIIMFFLFLSGNIYFELCVFWFITYLHSTFASIPLFSNYLSLFLSSIPQ